jgi:hypothetical protein
MALKVVVGPEIVISQDQVKRPAGAGEFADRGQNLDGTLGNPMAVLKPEIKEVAQIENFGALLSGHV